MYHVKQMIQICIILIFDTVLCQTISMKLDIGKALKYQRELNKLSQRELARLTGITQASISRWEANVNSISIEDLCTLADFYKISIDELIGRID